MGRIKKSDLRERARFLFYTSILEPFLSGMKIERLVLATSHLICAQAYQRPKWRELLALWNVDEESDISARKDTKWGKPMTPKYRHYTECESLPLPDNAESLECDQSTCAVRCKPGFHVERELARAQCRTFMGEISWTNSLSDCFGCGPPPLRDSLISPFCFIEEGSNNEICELKCKSPLLRTKGLKRAQIQCRCRESAHSPDCFWRMGSGRKPPNFKKIRCANKKTKKVAKIEAGDCLSKANACTSILKKVKVQKTWSCSGCFLVRAKLKHDEFPHIDLRDTLVLEFSRRVGIKQWSYPIRAVDHEEYTKWKVSFNTYNFDSVGEINFLAEFKHNRSKPKVKVAQFCPCEDGSFKIEQDLDLIRPSPM